MKKNGFLTFVFACIPGAGQMYYGYMKRGLSLISFFCIGVGLGALIGPLLIICPIIWMYSFFDTYDLIRHMTHGDPKPDSLLFFENLESLGGLFSSGGRVIGWILIALGAWALYSSILEPIIGRISWYIANMIPTLVVAGLLIAGGIWLIRGPRRSQGGTPPSFPGGNGYDTDYGPDPEDMTGFPDLSDDTFGTGPAPGWPRAGVRGTRPDSAQTSVPDAGPDSNANPDDTAGNA